MNYDYSGVILDLHKELDRKIVELEATCFDLKATEAATASARSRRVQLIAVRDFLNQKTRTL